LFGDDGVVLYSCSKDRRDYVYHPPSGERLSDASVELVRQVAMREPATATVVVVVSDGLNVNALLLHAAEFLRHLYVLCANRGLAVFPRPIFVRNGRVRAGYHLGSILFGAQACPGSLRCIIHCIGERPGSGTDAFSAYITAARPQDWSKVDHNCTQVVAGVSSRALAPSIAATRVFDIVVASLAENI
jgi:ethanolamine ammonia-lyase large subunit